MATVEADRDRLYLYTSPTNALVMPRRAFADHRAVQEFEAQARAFRADLRLTETTQTVQDLSSAEAVWLPPPVYAPLPTAPCQEEEADPLLTPLSSTVEAVYSTRPADLWRAQGRVLLRRPALLLPAVIPYTLATAVWAFPRMPFLPALGLACAVGVAGAAVTLLLTTRAAIAKRFAKFQDGRPCRTVVRPYFVCDITPEGRTTLRWPLVAAIEVQNGDVTIRTQAGGALIVPRSAFAGVQKRMEFVDTLRRFQSAGRDRSS